MPPKLATRPPWYATAFILAGVVALPALAAAADLPGLPHAARFDFPADDDFLVIEYSVHHDELAENDPTPLLRIYGDGTVRVHLPPYMKGAGDRQMQLSQKALRALLAALGGHGVLDFDTQQVERSKAAAEVARRDRDGSFIDISDTSWTLLRIRLAQYDPFGTGLVSEPLDRRIAWPDLAWHLEHYPELSSLHGLAAAEVELRTLLDHQDLSAADRVED